MTRAPLAALLALAVALVGSCGAPLVKLPAGPGAPAADALPALAAATSACRAASTLTAEAGVSGSIEGVRVRARVVMGLAAPASARLEARAVGQQLFTLVAVNEMATLLLDQDRRKLEGAPARDVMEALAGVPIGSRALRVVLTGCAEVPDSAQGSQLGPAWRRIDHGGSSYFLNREDTSRPWRLVVTVHTQPLPWRAEYRAFDEGGLPREIRLRAEAEKGFDLRLTLQQVSINDPLGPEVFQLTIPASFTAMTVAELARSGPLGGSAR